MSSHQERPLAEDTAIRVDDRRLARQWTAVSGRLQARPRRRFYVAALVPAMIVAVAAFLVLVGVRPWKNSHGDTSSRAPDFLVLPDGSRVELSSAAEVAVAIASRERVQLDLRRGTLDLDVTHVEGRPFVVRAGGHDVTVLGTAFVVKLEDRDGKPTLSVVVKRGRVRVAGPTGEHVLDAGQSWSALVEAHAMGPSSPPYVGSSSSSSSAPSTATAATAPPSPAATILPDPMASADPSSALRPSRDPVAAAASSGEASARAIAPPVVEGPRELLARATEARAAGRPRDAAAALDTLRKRHRSDARAGLAAFELGRVRMDALHDLDGAAEAFGDAITLAPGAPFREDAEARRVEALDGLGDPARCERARDSYLTRYPAGLHAKQIAQRCKRP